MELAAPESRARPRKEGGPLKLISTGWPTIGAGPFLGARSHLLGECYGNSQCRPQLSELSFSRAQSKVSGQVFVDWLSYSLSPILLPLLFSPYVTCRSRPDFGLVHQEGCEKSEEGECGKMLPDSTGVCVSEGSQYCLGTKGECTKQR